MRRCVGYIHIEGFYAEHERKEGREGPFAVELDEVRAEGLVIVVAAVTPAKK